MVALILVKKGLIPALPCEALRTLRFEPKSLAVQEKAFKSREPRAVCKAESERPKEGARDLKLSP